MIKKHKKALLDKVIAELGDQQIDRAAIERVVDVLLISGGMYVNARSEIFIAKDKVVGSLIYKGFVTMIQYDPEEDLYYGKIEGINELVGWQCSDAKDIVGEYQDLVDMYESNWLKRQDKNDDCI